MFEDKNGYVLVFRLGLASVLFQVKREANNLLYAFVTLDHGGYNDIFVSGLLLYSLFLYHILHLLTFHLALLLILLPPPFPFPPIAPSFPSPLSSLPRIKKQQVLCLAQLVCSPRPVSSWILFSSSLEQVMDERKPHTEVF